VVPDLIKLMKALSTASGSSEHEIAGIADPFLQARQRSWASAELMTKMLTVVRRRHGTAEGPAP